MSIKEELIDESTITKNNNPQRWRTMLESYLREAASNLCDAAEDITRYVNHPYLGAWLLDGASTKIDAAKEKMKWAREKLAQTTIPEFAAEEQAQEAEG